MKKTTYLIAILAAHISLNAYGINCRPQISASATGMVVNAVMNCWNDGRSGAYNFSNGQSVHTCQTCDTGYVAVTEYAYVDDCGQVSYTNCDCKCSGCSSSDYTDIGNGYERRELKTCSCSSGSAKCVTSGYSYRCAQGYWGSSSNGTSGCTRCDPSGGAYGTTASAGTTAKTGCYLPSGTSFSETPGSGTYTGNCYWAN